MVARSMVLTSDDIKIKKGWRCLLTHHVLSPEVSLSVIPTKVYAQEVCMRSAEMHPDNTIIKYNPWLNSVEVHI
jgi:hypothetical protein